MVKVKICGITNLADAQAALKSGADALGFVFYKKSPRYVAPAKAGEIIKKLPKRILTVGVFVDAPAAEVKRIAKLCGLKAVQFHGKETPEYCRQFRGLKVIKTFRIKKSIDAAHVARYNNYTCLFDTFTPRAHGGTGRSFNWKLLKNFARKHTVFLSGGLNIGNVRHAIAIVKPAWVDVSSSVEIKPGLKDPRKVKAFIKKVKRGRYPLSLLVVKL